MQEINYTEDLWRVDEYNNKIHKTAIIYPNVLIGNNNIIGAYCVIGSNGEMRGVNQEDFKGRVVIGSDNVISEYVSIQRPLEEDKITFIGDNNLIMRNVHFGHDAKIGSNNEIGCNTIISGFTVIKDNVKIKLNVTTRNRITIGENSIIGMGSIVTKDIPDNEIWYGSAAKFIRKV